MTTIDILSIDQDMPWRPWAVFYFLLIGASVGATLLAVYARFAGRRDGSGALMAGTALALAAPLPLLADLHQPARFMHFYLSLATDSVMWWGSWLLPLYIGAVALLAVVVAFGLGARRPLLETALFAAAGLFGLGILGYTAGEMTLVAARPLWHAPGFPVTLTLTALTAGAGAAMLFDAARGTIGIGRHVVAVGSALALVVLGLWMLTDPAMEVLTFDHAPVGILGGLFALGLGLPSVLALAAGESRLMRALAGLAAVFGALVFRWELFTGAQLMSKTETAFFARPSLTAPDTLQAFVGSLGVLVLAVIAVVVLFTVLAPRFGRHTHA